MNLAINLMERGMLPESLVRFGIRKQVQARLKSEKKRLEKIYNMKLEYFTNMLKKNPIAVETDAANDQHYMVNSEFFKLCLGSHLKYSSCYFPEGVNNLDDAEIASLEQVANRAEIKDGQNILELGCGWGSFSLWAAQNYPNATIIGVSNSSSQREFIENKIKELKINNLKIITTDINELNLDDTFDRIVSIEMFEHMRNYELLLKKISGLLNDHGKLFVHVFSHKEFAYLFESDNSWMAKYFFTGGLMPSHDLLSEFQSDLKLNKTWQLSGVHYQKTAEAWASNLKENKAKAMDVLEVTYGKKDAKLMFNRWVTFYLACSELFGYKNGNEWGVSHYLFEK